MEPITTPLPEPPAKLTNPDLIKLSAFSAWLTYTEYKAISAKKDVTKRVAITDLDVPQETAQAEEIEDGTTFQMRDATIDREVDSASLTMSEIQNLDNYCVLTDRTLEKEPFYKENGELAGFLIRTDKEIIVAYRGTMTMGEIKNDLDNEPALMTFGSGEESKELYVSRGFRTEYNSSQKNMLGALERLVKKSGDLPIVFTGHSLGAAAAGFAALDFRLRKENAGRDITVVAIGAPRSFSTKTNEQGQRADQVFNEVLGDSTLRLNTTGDWVPTMPREASAFAHVGWKVTQSAGNNLSPLTSHLRADYNTAIDRLTQAPETLSAGLKQSTSLQRPTSQTPSTDSSYTFAQFYQFIVSYTSSALRSLLRTATPSASMKANQVHIKIAEDQPVSQTFLGMHTANENYTKSAQTPDNHPASHPVDELRHKFHVENKSCANNATAKEESTATPIASAKH